MKKLCLAFLFCVLGFVPDVAAMGNFRYMYKTSCLPEINEFRAEVRDFFSDSEDWDWKRRAKQYGLYELNAKTDAPKPEPREEQCVMGDIEYKMKFIPVFVRSYYATYKMAVQLFAGEKYLGILFPFGAEYDGIYNTVGIKNGEIFVHGCTFEGANRSACRYDYKEFELPGETSYELSVEEGRKTEEAFFNVLEFNCYDGLEKAYADLRFYDEGTSLPENYYRLQDNPEVKCGDVTMQFDVNGSVSIKKDNKMFTVFNLNSCDKQVFQITFNPVNLSSVDVEYFDKKELYRQSKKCFEGEKCFSCLSKAE